MIFSEIFDDLQCEDCRDNIDYISCETQSNLIISWLDSSEPLILGYD